jgi:hypothetical protein
MDKKELYSTMTKKHSTMTKKQSALRVTSVVLFALGILDIVRGIMHTFNINWAAATFARIDPHPDALILMGSFGISNFLTGFIYLYAARKMKEHTPILRLMIPSAYILGAIGLKASGVVMQSAYNGKYMMIGYLAICAAAYIYYRISLMIDTKLKSSFKLRLSPKPSSMKSILPIHADNTYPFHKSVTYIFGFLTAATLIRSLIHLLAPDGGANSIASIIVFPGTPDPNAVIYFVFSLWGLSQLLMGIFYVIVLIRYRNLIPLMFLFLFVEYTLRLVIGRILKPLADNYFIGTAPGEIGNYILIPLTVILLIWTLQPFKKQAAAGPVAPSVTKM